MIKPSLINSWSFGPASKAAKVAERKCVECGITISSTSSIPKMCDCCWSMLEAICIPFFREAHKEWVAENDLMLLRKMKLIGRVPYVEDESEGV
jgi:hypothetical protein